MQTEFKQYDIVWPKRVIHDKGGRMITGDSQVVILDIDSDGFATVCRYGNYLDSVTTHVSNLSRWKAKK